MFDIGTISLVLLFALIFLLAIGMPLGLASAFLAVVVLVMRFGPDLLFRSFGSGPLGILSKRIYDLLTGYVLISIPLFILMAALLERSGIAKDMYSSLNVWLSRTRGGIAIVTSIMAVIMAAMSGIIGGEVVLLGLIALPQMLRLGYNQNLAIGTICASGSLGTMIPPSIVLIIYGLITETSIKALFTAAFLPGFMLASFIIIYIIIRTQLNPDHAPLAEDAEDYSEFGQSTVVTGIFGALAVLCVASFVMVLAGFDGLLANGIFLSALIAVAALAGAGLSLGPKGQLFLAFLTIVVLGACVILFARVTFFELTGQNEVVEGVDPIVLGTTEFIADFAVSIVLLGLLLIFAFGRRRAARGWDMGKGLVAPMVIIGVVLGSIYMGITGITEAAGMGVVAVFLITAILYKSFAEWFQLFRANLVQIGIGVAIILAVGWGIGRLLGVPAGDINVVLFAAALIAMVLRLREMPQIVWDSLMRTIKSTGTIIWVTIGATALAGAYTIAGGPTYVANMIVGAELPAMGIILVMMVIFLFMGAFMDWVGIVLLIIPVFLPIVMKLPAEDIGFIGELNPRHVAIWFGVVFCMNMQVSFLSPPFGPAAFYLKSVAPPHISLTDIFKGFLPFIGIQILALSVLLIWPNIVGVFL